MLLLSFRSACIWILKFFSNNWTNFFRRFLPFFFSIITFKSNYMRFDKNYQQICPRISDKIFPGVPMMVFQEIFENILKNSSNIYFRIFILILSKISFNDFHMYIFEYSFMNCSRTPVQNFTRYCADVIFRNRCSKKFPKLVFRYFFQNVFDDFPAIWKLLPKFSGNTYRFFFFFFEHLTENFYKLSFKRSLKHFFRNSSKAFNKESWKFTEYFIVVFTE